MKSMIIGLVLLSACASCTQIAGWSGKNNDSTNVQGNSIASQVYRDESINQANAYSDLFLDSGRIEQYITQRNLADSTATLLRNFYLVRNYQYAWFSNDGLTEQARNLWSLYSGEKDSSGRADKAIDEKMDSLVEYDSVSLVTGDSSYVQTELALTEKLLDYAAGHPGTSINTRSIYTLVPAKRMDPMQLADSILNKQKDTTAYAGNMFYDQLKSRLAIYYAIASKGGWQSITLPGGALSRGSRSPVISAVKKRLQATKEYSGADTSNVFTDSLFSALTAWQQHNGFRPDGIITDSMVQTLNIPAEQRIRQLLVNMNRALWIQPGKEASRLEINIPSFMLYAYEDNNKIFEQRVIIGKEGTGTVTFSGKISEIVFDPAWNLPQSIVKNEIMPAMKTDPGYLKKHHMEIVKQSDSIPVIRQLPGKDNSLGKVKFLFPNSFDIYLHDTPDKSLFAKNDRALSHGCIRVADAEKLAVYLLRDQADWNQTRIQAAMNKNSEQKVSVKKPEPVFITYYTAWVDDQGYLNFRNDVYGHDNDAENKMFDHGG